MPCALVLAAGRGTRMKSDEAKVLHPLSGQPLLAWVLAALKKARFEKVCVVIGHQATRIKQTFRDHKVWALQTNQRGTADAVRSATSWLKHQTGSVIVLAGDVPLIQAETIHRLIQHHEARNAQATVLSMRVNDPTGYGRILRNSRNELLAIREELEATLEEKEISEVNTSIYAFEIGPLLAVLSRVKPSKTKKEFYLTDVIEHLRNQGGRVEALCAPCADEVEGINTRWDLAEAEKVMQEHILKSFTEKGVTIVQPATTYIEAGAEIGKDTIVFPFSFIEKGVKIGAKCKIGPFCRLRTGAVIEEGAEIGSFVEVVRSRVGKKTLIKHLSYVGDATIGKEVNIGAGFVTANYDGKHKHKTVVGDNAFVGVKTVLVAPVKLGKKSKTGAGAVVLKNRNVPAGALAVGLPAQVVNKKRSS